MGLESVNMLLMMSAPGLAVGLLVLKADRMRMVRVRGNSLQEGSPWLASRREERAFRELQTIYPPSHYTISAHMLLIDVIGRQEAHRLVPRDREFAWKAHCDFVIVSVSRLRIEKVVEVNGPFHQRADQQDRDKRKRQILAQFHIGLEIR